MSQINVTKINHESGAGDNIILSADGDTQVNSLNGGQLAGIRNQLINGNFTIWQRGITQTFTGIAPNNYDSFYLADRWRVSLKSDAGVNGTASRTSFATFGIPGVAWGINLAQPGATGIGINQMVEITKGAYSQFSSGSTWTLSWWTDNANVISDIRWAETVGDVTGSVFTQTAPTVLETIGTFSRYASTITVSEAPEAEDLGLRVTLYIADTVAPDSFSIAGVQLEPGPVATPFEFRPAQTEVALCQRYYEAAEGGQGSSAFWSGYAQIGTLNYVVKPFLVQKRVVPAVSLVAVSTSNVDSASVGVTQENISTMGFRVEGPASATAGGSYFLCGWTADAEL